MSPGSSEAHSKLVAQVLEALALSGIFAWPNRTGSAEIQGRRIPFGKKGSGDIIAILPPNGRHCEIEIKTGNAVQSKFQKIHQRMVERMGGLYIVVRSLEDLVKQLAQNGISLNIHASQPAS